ncbi:MAG: PepSY domain-containing protein [Methylococcaceae bacterium]|nr:PepSY domain-containing protein [Methylococcaceae bacterium]
MTRRHWVRLHRYAGLYLAFFLTVSGLTGCLMAFYHELDVWLNPQLWKVNPVGQRKDIYELIEIAELMIPHGKVVLINLADIADEALRLSIAPKVDPATTKPYVLEVDDLFLNPYTGEKLGSRLWGNISFGRETLMTLIYRLHYELALPYNIGKWLFGIAAIIWTLDCFVGFYLTLPRGRPFWKKWLPAWQIKTSSSLTRINFDLHRAGGLWLWTMLLVFAWSAVYLNLGEEVYLPTMKKIFAIQNPRTADLQEVINPVENPTVDWHTAREIGAVLMLKCAKEQNFSIEHEEFLIYDSSHGVYRYGVKSSRDVGKHGLTTVFFNGSNGEYKALSLPTGQYAGNTITTWLIELHMASIWGLPYKIFVCVLGMVVTMLSVTGVVIWLRKRQAARVKHNKITPGENLPELNN